MKQFSCTWISLCHCSCFTSDITFCLSVCVPEAVGAVQHEQVFSCILSDNRIVCCCVTFVYQAEKSLIQSLLCFIIIVVFLVCQAASISLKNTQNIYN